MSGQPFGRDGAGGPATVHTTQLRVRIKEVAYDHVYFGTAFTWFEVARAELSRSAGTPYSYLVEHGLGSFVTTASATYRKPIPPSGDVRIECRLASMGRLRFAFAYSIFDDDPRTPYVTGHTEHAVADLSGRLRRVPAEFAAAFHPTGEAVPRANLSGPVATHWTHDLRVRYEETDAFRVVYYGNYFAWMEAAWSGRLADGPWDIARNAMRGRVFGVINADCRYLSPARYDDLVTLRAGVTPVGKIKVQLDYRIERADTGEQLALGRTVHVATDGGRIIKPPDDLWAALGVPRE